MKKKPGNILSKYDMNNPEELEAAAAEVLKTMEKENKTFSEVLNIDEASLEELYAFGYTLYNQGKYGEAISLFYALVQADPKTYRFALGLAASLHQLKDYENAAYAFYNAWMLLPEDPNPLYFIADCFIKSDQPEQAIEALNDAIDVANMSTKYDELKNKCVMIKKGLTENKRTK